MERGVAWDDWIQRLGQSVERLIGDFERVSRAVHQEKVGAGIDRLREQTTRKADGSPVSPLDRWAHEQLIKMIRKWPVPYGALPIVSEEDAVRLSPEAVRQRSRFFWLMDPLDGTRDMLAGETSYASVLALMEIDDRACVPRLGFISAPEFDGGVTWAGGAGFGLSVRRSQGGGVGLKSQDRSGSTGGIRVLGSRSLPADREAELVSLFGTSSVTRLGSAIKFGLIAEGQFDVYARLGPTGEWDTAAGQAILESTGGALWSLTNREPMGYGKREWMNSGFLAVGEADGFSTAVEALSRELSKHR